MAQTVVGVFDNASDAQTAVDHLVSAGFSRDNIDVSAYKGDSAGETNTTGSSDSLIPDRHQNTSGTLAEEVADDTKDVGSGIGGFFRSLFGDDENEDTHRYTTVASRSTVVTVHTQQMSDAERAADILDQYGAVDVNDRSAQYTTGTSAMGTTATTGTDNLTGTTTTTGTDNLTGTTNYTGTTDTDANQTVKIIEENLQVGKRTVETGGVRLRSRIVEKPVEEHLRLRQERVTVQRNPVNRVATDADLNAFQGTNLEVVEHAEVPVVAKEARVVEEISLGKEVSEKDETIRDTVRKTEVDVENITPSTTTGTTTGTSTTTDTDYSTGTSTSSNL